MSVAVHPEHARGFYDAMAPFYDDLTAHHDYERWVSILERLALEHGLPGRRLLDVACGTGKSFVPFLERGYEVTACDISPRMVELAAEKAGGRAELSVQDMRSLPVLGEFDLVCCLDDAVNYLLSEAELTAAFAGLRANLGPNGLLLFDANTLFAYRSFFASATVIRAPARTLVWNGLAGPEFATGGVAEGQLLAYEHEHDDLWRGVEAVHHQRHHPKAVVLRCLRRAGLSPAAVLGLRTDGAPERRLAERTSSKALYIARDGARQMERR